MYTAHSPPLEHVTGLDCLSLLRVQDKLPGFVDCTDPFSELAELIPAGPRRSPTAALVSERRHLCTCGIGLTRPFSILKLESKTRTANFRAFLLESTLFAVHAFITKKNNCDAGCAPKIAGRLRDVATAFLRIRIRPGVLCRGRCRPQG